ncbi:hypothetical protein J0H58_11880 [bacterium]|nr:hypothetical protein [bacterium]
MTHVRRIFPWLCAAALLFSGAVGRGVVLCFESDGNVRFEAADASGRCLEGEATVSHPESDRCATISSAAGHLGGCEDVSVSRDSVQPTSLGLEAALVLPTLLFDAAVALCEVPVEFVRYVKNSRSLPPPSMLSDVNAIRKTVTLLI